MKIYRVLWLSVRGTENTNRRAVLESVKDEGEGGHEEKMVRELQVC